MHSATVKSTEVKAMNEGPIIEFVYRNHRGEVSVRRAAPRMGSLRVSSGPWHDNKWVFDAWDLGKEACRTFSLEDCVFDERMVCLTKTIGDLIHMLAGAWGCSPKEAAEVAAGGVRDSKVRDLLKAVANELARPGKEADDAAE